MKQLIVAGLGIKDLSQLTLECVHWLQKADEVLYLGTAPEKHTHSLKKMGSKKIVPIINLYIDGDIDEKNYSRLYDTTVASANSNNITLLLVPGHPRIGVSLVQRLETSQEQNSFQLKILPGISSFDTMLNDLARDPLEKGSLIVDANRILLFNSTWDATFDCFIYHVCSVGTRRVHLSDAKIENDWASLKAHLLKIYSPTTTIELVSSQTTEDEQSTNCSAPLCELERLLENVHFGTTLFIPGQKPKMINRGFLKQLRQSVNSHG